MNNFDIIGLKDQINKVVIMTSFSSTDQKLVASEIVKILDVNQGEGFHVVTYSLDGSEDYCLINQNGIGYKDNFIIKFYEISYESGTLNESVTNSLLSELRSRSELIKIFKGKFIDKKLITDDKLNIFNISIDSVQEYINKLQDEIR